MAKPKTHLSSEGELECGHRHILTGLAEHVDADGLIGCRGVAAANLKPHNMKGLASQGMLIMAEDRTGSSPM